MATFVPRAAWGGRAPRSRPTNITPEHGGVTVHHVGPTRTARSDHGDCAGQVRGIQNHHMDTNGWADIAYTHLVCVHGYVFEGRGPGVRTAANGTSSGNQNWYAVCALTGGSTTAYDTVTDRLLDAFRWSIAHLRDIGGAGRGINRHSDHTPTACPGGLSSYVQDGSLEPGAGPPAWPGVVFAYPPGIEHPGVRVWQQRMRDLGWTIGVDGRYGPRSRRVCERFQAERGLPVDGVVGPKTWEESFR
ncbi:MAG TPA: peptidoglycan-binding domain-containing protein [Streptomyces sp.]|uniref:peptidoglycan-binding domain-containing protein n=1 Tax=Streptomyces sp. TaxID=1931 RepID=UPI002D3FBDC7|nr:peptidoglycan-binding domain-containing protein [Streptomyces sp.]HZG05143.1 peptidoglycan-binding domain-containing protein [Streptomyces sp.]